MVEIRRNFNTGVILLYQAKKTPPFKKGKSLKITADLSCLNLRNLQRNHEKSLPKSKMEPNRSFSKKRATSPWLQVKQSAPIEQLNVEFSTNKNTASYYGVFRDEVCVKQKRAK